MKTYRNVFWLNIVAFLLVVLVIISTKLSGSSVSELFLYPFFDPSPDVALLTRTFQLLCAVPVVVCAFTFCLLSAIAPHRPENKFILCSALLTGGFLVNEIYRIHIYLLVAGVPKLVTVGVYALVAVFYGWAFRKRISATPYILLLTGMGLLFLGIIVDSLKLEISGFSSLLEGIPKLFSEINIVLYFWYVCYQEVLRSLENRWGKRVLG